MFRAVLFDLDGVLVDSAEAWLRVMSAAAREFGCPPVERDALNTSFGQGVQDDAELFYPGRTPEEVARYYHERFAEHVGHVVVDPEAAPLLEALHARGLRSGLVTNTPTAIAWEILEGVGLELDVVVGAEEGVRDKPAPDMLFRACELLGVRPPEALFVGDSRYDREAAAAAGTPFVGLRIPGDRNLANLGDLSQIL
jgi:phosphoglycolate phosphatase/AHBA synthesis associated protein